MFVLIFHQRNGFVRNLFLHFLMGLTAHNFMNLLFWRHKFRFSFSVQAHMGFQRQYPVKGVAEAFLRNASVQIPLFHTGKIFLHFIEKQEHVHTGGNGSRKHVAPLHAAGKAYHMGSVCQHHTVKSQFPPEKSLNQFRRQGGRHHLVIRKSRIKMPGIIRLHNMSCHNGF